MDSGWVRYLLSLLRYKSLRDPKMILPDYPIKTIKEDKLNRARLALKVAELVKGFKGKESFVIGIESPWGNGKTSFINMIEESLGKSVKVLYFNPWNFSNEESLLSDFFGSYLVAVKNEDQEIYKNIKKYSRKLNFSFNPEITIGLVSFSFGSANKSMNSDETTKTLRDKIDSGLKKSNKKILVVIDDIDRLDGRETRLIFKIVKQTANFPNTIFVLAYDRNQVEKRLSIKEDGLDGGEYLKKIVQISFSLPDPDPQQLWQLLFSDLDVTIEEIYGKTDFDQTRWGNLFHGGFKELFVNIRDIKRYISSLRLDWSIIGKDDITLVDFIGVEAIRVFAPQFYGVMAKNKTLFTNTGDYYAGLKNNGEIRKKQYEEVLSNTPNKLREPIDGVCKQLFPQLNFNTTYGSEFEQTWRTELRVCSQEKFPFYFALGIPTGSISEADITNLLSILNEKENFVASLLDFYKDGKIRKVLSRIVDYIKDIKDEDIKNFLLGIWEVQSQVEDKRTGMWDFEDVNNSVMRLGYQTIKQKVLPQNRYKLLSDLLKETKNVYPTVYLAGLLVKEYEEKASKPNEEFLLDEKATAALKKELASKLETYSKDGMSADKDISFLLFRWKAFVGDEKPNKYISGLINNKKDLANLLVSFVSNSFSQGFNDYVPTKNKKLDRKSLEKLYPIAEIEKKIAKITSKDLAIFSEDQREAVKLFRENKKDKFNS